MEEKNLTLRQKIELIDKRDWYLIIGVTLINITIVAFVVLSGGTIEEYAALGYLGVFTANILNSAVLFSPLPAFAVTFLAASQLDPVILIIISSIAAAIGESAIYLAGDGIDKLVNDFRWHKFIRRLFDRSPFLFLVVWISIPNPIQAFGQMFAGSVSYPFWKYFLATLLGNFIWFVLVVYSGQWLFEQGILSF